MPGDSRKGASEPDIHDVLRVWPVQTLVPLQSRVDVVRGLVTNHRPLDLNDGPSSSRRLLLSNLARVRFTTV